VRRCIDKFVCVATFEAGAKFAGCHNVSGEMLPNNEYCQECVVGEQIMSDYLICFVEKDIFFH
jgi:hypothetical protein